MVSRCTLFEVPPLRIPQCPPFSPGPCITTNQGKEPGQRSPFSWISFTVIVISLNAQGAEGDWRKLVFPLVSLWVLWLVIPRTGSWRNLGGKHSSDQPGFLTLLGYNWLGKASGLHKLLPWLVGEGGWFSSKVKWVAHPWELRCPHPCPKKQGRNLLVMCQFCCHPHFNTPLN